MNPAETEVTLRTPAYHEPTPTPAGGRETVLRARRGWIAVDWRELWDFRELFGFLVWRDIKARYKQAVLGLGWAVLQPLIALALMTTIGGLAGIRDRVQADVPYALFVYSGLLPWLFCSTSISKGGQALVSQQALLTKIYLPRIFLPAASVGAALVDMLISAVLFAGLIAVYGYVPSWQVVFLPVLIGMTFVVALGIVLSVSALTVLYRDMRVIIPFLVQIGMWGSAVFYPASMLGDKQWVLMLNPIAGLIGAYRSAIFGLPWQWNHLAISGALTVVIFVFGLFYFRRCERRFADLA